ncbi:MAG: helix-turn-helix domain-containing protein [Candidatus Desulfofervidus auxilii]|nr:helix-turn-helix domain-containing protein [Candidatus Desulfofervidus auxilii]
MKQKELALKAGISPQHLNDILHNRKKPSVRLIRKLAMISEFPLEFWVSPRDYPELLQKITRKKQ